MSNDQRKPLARVHLQPRAVPQSPPVERADRQPRPATTVSLSNLPAMRGPAAIDLAGIRVDLATLKLVPRVVALAHKLLPFGESPTDLEVVMAQPDNRKAIDELEFVTGKTVRAHAVAADAELVAMIRSAYDAMERGEAHYQAAARAPLPVPPPPPAAPPPAPVIAARPTTRPRSVTPPPSAPARTRSRTPPPRRRASSTALQNAVVSPSTPARALPPRRPARDSRSDDE